MLAAPVGVIVKYMLLKHCNKHWLLMSSITPRCSSKFTNIFCEEIWIKDFLTHKQVSNSVTFTENVWIQPLAQFCQSWPTNPLKCIKKKRKIYPKRSSLCFQDAVWTRLSDGIISQKKFLKHCLHFCSHDSGTPMRSFQTSVFLSGVDPPSLLPMTDGAAARVDDCLLLL